MVAGRLPDSTFEARALLIAAVPVKATRSRRSTASLGFPVPATTAQVERLSVTQRSSVAHAWSVYTSGHNIQRQQYPSVDFTECALAPVLPCADFAALIAGNRAPLVPVNQQPINDGRIQISAALTRASATQLAATLRS